MQQILIENTGWQAFFSAGGFSLGVAALLVGFGVLVEGYRLWGWLALVAGFALVVSVFSYFDLACARSLAPGVTARGLVWPRGELAAARQDFAAGGIEAFRARAEREKLSVRYYPAKK